MTKQKKGLKIAVAVFLIIALLSGGLFAGRDHIHSFVLAQRAQIVQKLFDRFTQELFKESLSANTLNLHSLLADPDAYGIEAEASFGTYSLEQMRQAPEQIRKQLKLMEHFPNTDLTERQQLAFRVMQQYFETSLLCEGMELYDEPLRPTIGIQAQLPILLSEYAFGSREEVELYLTLLTKLNDYYSQLIAYEQAKAEAGLFMSDRAAEAVVASCQVYLEAGGTDLLLDTFTQRLEEVPGLTEAEKSAYEARNRQLVQNDFTAAYQLVIDGLNDLKGSGDNELGLAHLERGKKYYEYLIAAKVGTSYTSMEAVNDAIEQRMAALLSRYQELNAAPQNVSQYLLVRSADPVWTEPQAILSDLKQKMQADFPAPPDIAYALHDVPQVLEPYLSPAFYILPPVDQPTKNVIFINRGVLEEGYDLYTVLAHEGYPGHMYQTAMFYQTDPVPIRHLFSTTGYNEGWGTYVELLAYEYAYADFPAAAELLAIERELNLALCALLDLKIHYYGYDLAQVQALYDTMFVPRDAETMQGIFNHIVDTPANYMQYYLGYLELSEMRSRAETTLGAAFDPVAFHRMVLRVGPVPFTLLWEYFDAYLAAAA